ncbi:MAG: glycosyltransferase family 4 protein [Planctomycetota bacterium]
MKLAIVVDTFPCWSERFIAREVAELRRRGVDLTVFCLNAGHLTNENDHDWTDLLKNRIVLPSRFFKIFRVATLRKLLRGNFQHVHAHFASLPSTLAWRAAMAEKISFSMSVHARDLWVESQMLRQKIADATCVFACHTQSYEYLVKIAPHAEKVVLMRHGLPLNQFPFTPRLMLKKNKTMRFLAAGRFVPKKGFNELIEALALPTFAEKKFVLTLLGDGPKRKKLAAQIKQRNLEKKIVIQPPAGGSELREIFNQADAFLAPYQQAPDGDSDGVPNVVLEAFALGLPVIGTSAGGLKEVLTLETGYVVTAEKIAALGKTAALANAILEFLAAPEKALAKTTAARALVEREYDIRKNITPLLELVEIVH